MRVRYRNRRGNDSIEGERKERKERWRDGERWRENELKFGN